MRYVSALALLGLVSVFGCTNVSKLERATKLVIAPDSEWEKVFESPELRAFLTTFEVDRGFKQEMVSNEHTGYIEIDGKQYPVEYQEVKIASRPIRLNISLPSGKVRLRQTKPYFSWQRGNDGAFSAASPGRSQLRLIS